MCLLNTAHIAQETGTNLFGFNGIPDIRKFDYMHPFSTRNRWRDDRYAFLAKHYTNKGGLCAHRTINKEIECIKILQQKFGKHIVGTVKDKPWKVILKKL